MRLENVDPKYKLTKVTSQLETTKLQFTKFEKDIIVKGELKKIKKFPKKLYSSTKNIDERIMGQKPIRDKTWIGYVEGESPKRSKRVKEMKIGPRPKKKPKIDVIDKGKKRNQDETKDAPTKIPKMRG